MATPKSQVASHDVHSDYGSDIEVFTPSTSEYGSDFDPEEEILIGDLLSSVVSPGSTSKLEKTLVYSGAEEGQNDTVPTVLVHSSPPSAVVRLERGATVELPPRRERADRNSSIEIEYEGLSRQVWNAPSERSKLDSDESVTKDPNPQSIPSDPNDTRSPLDRFRTKPKKPLSVTDLVSPAWCELQYWYVLTKLGRKPRTAAMKKGSEVHRALEEQVHTTVPIETTTKEDSFGLKLWNTIQRLRTLRETGLTRELEVWGVVDGQVVNGVIDELSYTCPDPEYEESLEKSRIQRSGGTLPLGQLSIAQSFAKSSGQGDSWLGVLESDKTVYLTDVKTRGARSVPAGASMRPTWMQLMLYRKLLESLALNTVDAETIFARYDLQPRKSFSETFIKEISGVGGGLNMLYEDENLFAMLQDSEINAHNNLILLWSLMVSEFSHAITSLSDVLRAEFRYSKTGELIGSEVFAYSANIIEDYTSKQLDWWKGRREAKGVEIEEAFKCRICDFAEECTWRRTKVAEATEKHRLRAATKAKSRV